MDRGPVILVFAQVNKITAHLKGIDPEPVIAQAAGKDVIMLDYSLRTRELNDRLNRGAKSLRILDHHRTAEVVLAGAGYATFDMSRSGAGLAWDYLFGKDSESSKYSKKEWGDITYTNKNTVPACRGCNVWRGYTHSVQETLNHFEPMRNTAKVARRKS